jgi:hypothetical protein
MYSQLEHGHSNAAKTTFGLHGLHQVVRVTENHNVSATLLHLIICYCSLHMFCCMFGITWTPVGCMADRAQLRSLVKTSAGDC